MEKLMSYRRSIEQLRPARTQKVDLQEKVQSLLTEGFDTPIKTITVAKKFIIKKRGIQYKGLEELVRFLQQMNLVPQDKVILAYNKSNDKYKIRDERAIQSKNKTAIEKKVKELQDIAKEDLKLKKKITLGLPGTAKPELGKGTAVKGSADKKGGDVKSPTGAEWEDCICYYYNNPTPKSSTVTGANKKDEAYPIASKFFGTQYEEQGRELAKSFKKVLGADGIMKPLGSGGKDKKKKNPRSLTPIYKKSVKNKEEN